MFLGRLLLAVTGHDADIFTLYTDLCLPLSALVLNPFLAVHQNPGLVNVCFWHLLFAMLFIVLFFFAWESCDKSTGLKPNLVFGPCNAAVPVLREPSRGDN